MSEQSGQQRAEHFREAYQRLADEIGKVIVGHRDVIEGVLTSLFVGGHVLLEGVPGLGKTLLVRTLSDALNLKFNRIQFTPDLMPSDVMGTNIITESPKGGRAFTFQRGPIFAQIVLADEINRATPKTQSALLEAMQEKSVTVGGTIHRLDSPFFVLATQNPIEQEGTYPLPEAQLDRFFFKLVVGYSTREDLAEILNRTTTGESPRAEKVMEASEIIEHQQLVRDVLVAEPIQDYAIRLILATHPNGEFATEVTNQYIRCGASPRGAQAVLLGSKVRALVQGRFHISVEDIQHVYLAALRHRIILSFEAMADNIEPDSILEQIQSSVSLPS